MNRRLVVILALLTALIFFVACGPKEVVKFALMIEIEGQGQVGVQSGMHPQGEILTFGITPETGWVFAGWGGRSSGDIQQAGDKWSIFMDNDKHLIAIFEKDGTAGKHSLNVEIQGEGTVEPRSGEFEDGYNVAFTLAPKSGWFFSHWAGEHSGDVQKNIDKWHILMDEDKNLVAVFVKGGDGLFRLNVDVNGNGLVNRNPNQEAYEPDTVVTLEAVPGTGWAFSNWQGDISGTSSVIEVRMNDNKEILAIFEPMKYNLEVKIIGDGTVEEELMNDRNADYPFGSAVKLTALPNPGSIFREWSGDVTGSSRVAYLDMNDHKQVTAIFEKDDQYQLEVTIVGKGQVEEKVIAGADTAGYPHQAVVKLTAIPNNGWAFKEWQGDASGKDKEAYIEMDRNKGVVAVFVERQHSLYLEVIGQGYIDEKVINSSSEHPDGAVVQLKAIPETGWLFSEWKGDVNSKELTILVEMDSDKHLIAVFELEKTEYFKLNVDITGSGYVVKTPDADEYEAGILVKLKAIPETGWVFKEWQKDAAGTANEIQVKMDMDKNVRAVFQEKASYYKLDVEISGEGQVIKSPNADDYEAGTLVTLIATASSGWVFEEWTGDAQGTEATAQVEMTRNKKVKAIFKEKAASRYTLNVYVSGNGKIQVEPEQEDYKAGEEVTLTAVPDAKFEFKEWLGDVKGTDGTITITMDKDKTIVGVFVKKEEAFKLEITIVGEGMVTKTPDEESYDEGTIVTLAALPKNGWEFKEWQGAINDNNAAVQLEMNEDKAVTAVFVEKAKCYKISINKAGKGQVTKNPDKAEYPEGTLVILTAEPANGYEFREWFGDVTGTSPQVQLEMDSDKEIIAIFSEPSAGYRLNVNISGEGTVKKTPDASEYEQDAKVALEAIPATGWVFKDWRGDVTGTSNKATVTMDKETNVTASFEKKLTRYKLTTSVNGGLGYITRTPDQTDYEAGTIVDVKAVPSYNYYFNYWLVEGNYHYSDSFKVLMDKDKRAYAYFSYSYNP